MTSSAAAVPKPASRNNTAPKPESKPLTRGQSVGLVFLCTVIGAAAQIFMKVGVNRLHGLDPIRVVSDLPLLAGYALLGISMLLLMLALRDGELSVLYPILGLSYVWVAILSAIFFHDKFNPWKIAGIVVIMAGVAILGRAGKR